MSRYIDVANYCENFCHCNNDYCDKPSCPILNAPTADVVEVKHGKWELLDECANAGVYCSVCRKKVYWEYYANVKPKSKYCPNCGARMEAKE